LIAGFELVHGLHHPTEKQIGSLILFFGSIEVIYNPKNILSLFAILRKRHLSDIIKGIIVLDQLIQRTLVLKGSFGEYDASDHMDHLVYPSLELAVKFYSCHFGDEIVPEIEGGVAESQVRTLKGADHDLKQL